MIMPDDLGRKPGVPMPPQAADSDADADHEAVMRALAAACPVPPCQPALSSPQPCPPPPCPSAALVPLAFSLSTTGHCVTAPRTFTPCPVPQPPHDVKPLTEPFPFTVPDYILMDTDLAKPKTPEPQKDKKGRAKKRPLLPRPWLNDVVRYQVWMQKRSPGVLPDLLLKTLIWGTAKPKDWRRTLRKTLAKIGLSLVWTKVCDDGCPLHGSGPKHRHTTFVAIQTLLGRMQEFVTTRHEDGTCEFDWVNRIDPEAHKAATAERLDELAREIAEREGQLSVIAAVYPGQLDTSKRIIKELKAEARNLKAKKRPGTKKVTGVRPTYLPIRLFGPSPKSGMTPLEVNVMAAITGEMTRVRGQTCRPDRAQLIDRDHRLGCGYLNKGKEYVLFAGNGRPGRDNRHGRGYKLQTWMARSAMPMRGSEYDVAEVKLFMRLLSKLKAPFGLIVVAYHPKRREWRCLDELVTMTRSISGRKWLAGCLLRVYTECNYLGRWRAYFAQQLGYSSIPDGSEVPPAEPGLTVTSAEQLRQWMEVFNLDDAQVAEALGTSRSLVTRYRLGSRNWSLKFQAKLNRYLATGSAV
jgi:hypothetical protein